MDIEPYNTITNIILIGFRLFVTLLVVDTMKFYNRSTFGWGLLSFILPAVAMISAAFVKPLKKNKNKKVSK